MSKSLKLKLDLNAFNLFCTATSKKVLRQFSAVCFDDRIWAKSHLHEVSSLNKVRIKLQFERYNYIYISISE